MYHLRDMMGTVQKTESGQMRYTIVRFEDALATAYKVSSETNKSIEVCRDSVGGYVALCSVRCLP